jgi:hypothetical protein
MTVRAIPLVLLAIALGGCGSSSPKQPESSQRAAQPKPVSSAVPHPTVHFKGPAVIHSGSSFKVTVALGHFKMAPNMVGMAPVPGKGHLHFMLDGGKYDTPRYAGANGVIGKKLGVTGAYSPAVAPNITYSHLPPGRYTLVCMLANNNHTPVGVEAKETIVVR